MNTATAAEANRTTANRALRNLRRQSLAARCKQHMEEIVDEIYETGRHPCERTAAQSEDAGTGRETVHGAAVER